MKLLIAFTTLLFMVACSRAPSGTYAALGKDGEVARQGDGQPRLTISLEDGTAAFQGTDVGVELAQYKFVDGMLYITEPGNSEAMSLKVEGDLLLTTGVQSGVRFKKL